MNHNQGVPTLISLAVSALRASGGLGAVRVLRVLARDCQALVGGPNATSLPLVCEMRGLVEISLQEVGINVVPVALAGLAPTLAALDLSCNHLADLPSWMSQMIALRVLDLSSNQFAAVPACLAGMHQLARLAMSGNALDAIPDWFGRAMGSLRQLHLCDSFARGPRLPESFAALTNLRHLSLCCSPALGDTFDSWDDPGAAPATHPLWEPVYALTGLRSLVLHGASVRSVDGRIGQLSRLTSLQGLTCNQAFMGPEWARLTRLVDMDSSYIAASTLAHEFYALVRVMPRDKRPRVFAQPVDGPRCPLSPKWFVPQLVDLCLMAVSAPCAHSAAPEHVERRSHHASSSSRALCADGGGPFDDRCDHALYGVSRRDDDNGDGIDDSRVYTDAVPWCVDRGDSCDVDFGCGTQEHPLEPHVRALLPAELVERAVTASLRICALCARPIIGLPSRIDTTIADQRDLVLQCDTGHRMAVERALCARCAPAADACAM